MSVPPVTLRRAAGSLDDEIPLALDGSTPRTPFGWSLKTERRQSEWCSVSGRR